MANAVPDSLTPRRFTRVSRTTKPTDSGTACELSEGTADVIAATPATTETATVRT
jgi:hypothetical protein